jgi:pimeloyl-ACP methyl ester carboxylesterase
VVLPTIAATKTALGGIQKELETYSSEDEKVNRFGVLKEDELNIQLIATTAQRDATKRLIEANTAAADAMTAVPGLGDALRVLNSRLEMVLAQLESDIRDLTERLHLLRAFDAATRGLFTDSLDKLTSATGENIALLAQLNDAGSRSTLTDGLSADAVTANTNALAYLTGLSKAKDWSAATPNELAALLNEMSPSQMKRLIAAHPELLQRFWDHPPAPENTATWWKKLDTEQQKEWAKAVPRLVGNLDGVPPRVRSDANRLCLTADLAAAKKRLQEAKTDPYLVSLITAVQEQALKRLADAQRRADTLSRIDIAYGEGPTGNPPRELYVYQPSEHTKVAISTGLLEVADHISVVVPGMGTTADDIGQYGNAAKDLRQQQSKASGVDRSRIAVLSWLDYDPPGSLDIWGVTHDDLAKAGAERLGNTLRGLTAVKDWPANADGLSVVAHSYGTNVAALALTQTDVSTGHVVLLGSAGVSSSIPSAAALHVPGGEVYAAQGAQDEWAGLGQFLSGRTDPTNPRFGAHPFSAETGILDGHTLNGITKHGPFGNSPKNPDAYSYLDNLTSAQYATAMATMGRGQEIPIDGTLQDRSTLPNPQPLPSPTPPGSGR